MSDLHGGEKFERTLGLGHVTASGVAIIIGAGIFVLLGDATKRAGGLVWMSFLVASVLCALTALSYMELSSMYPKAASEYEFTRHAFPKWAAFTAGWSMTSALIVASATVSLGFARYFGEFVKLNDRIVALILLVVVVAVSNLGMGRAAWFIVGLGTLEVGGLIFVAIIGAPSIGDVDLLSGNGVSGIMGGAALIFFAFIGFNEVITLAEETRDARRTIPRALLLSLGISMLIYVAVAIAAVSVLGPESLANSTRPLTEVVSIAVGGAAVTVVGVIALISTASTVLLAVTAASRMLYGIASDGALPDWIGEVRKRRSPRNALAIVLVLTGILILIGDLALLAAATDAVIYAIFVLVNVVLIVLRKRKPDVERPFSVPFQIAGLPLLPLLGIVATILMATQLSLASILLAALLVVAGPVLFGGHRLLIGV